MADPTSGGIGPVTGANGPRENSHAQEIPSKVAIKILDKSKINNNETRTR
jgi:hypothetical protein